MGNEDINYGIMGQSDKASILYVLHAFLVLTKQEQQQNMELCCLLGVQSNLRKMDKISACKVQVDLLHSLLSSKVKRVKCVCVFTCTKYKQNSQ